MKRFEEEMFEAIPELSSHVVYRHRYVDDILCLWDGPEGALQEFLSTMNLLYPSIKFTLQIGENKINFLDLTISIGEGLHQYNIYRKPTSTDTVVHGTSCTWNIVLFPGV